jgi:hypothetical protein
MNYIYHNTYTLHTVQVQGKIFSEYDERDSVKKFVVFCFSHRTISPGPNIYMSRNDFKFHCGVDYKNEELQEYSTKVEVASRHVYLDQEMSFDKKKHS